MIMVMILPLSSFFFSSLSGSGTQWLSERDTIVHLGGSPPALLGTDYSPASWSRSGCSLSSSALVLGELLSPGRSDIPTAAWKHTHLLGGWGGSHQNTYLCKRSCEQTGTYGGRSQAALAATVDWTCGEIFTEHAEPICDCYSVMGGSWLCVCAPYRGPMKHLREEEETCVRLGRRSTPE